jgi:hypothetical protein
LPDAIVRTKFRTTCQDKPSTLDNIKAVAFDIEDLDNCFDIYGADVLLKFAALDTLILIEDYRAQPKKSNRKKPFANQLFEIMHPPTLDPPRFLKAYGDTATCDLSEDLKAHFNYFGATVPKFKQFENVSIFFTQLY